MDKWVWSLGERTALEMALGERNLRLEVTEGLVGGSDHSRVGWRMDTRKL